MKITSFAFALLTTSLISAPEDSLVRVNATLQSYSASQPWQKNSPRRRSGLGTLLPDQKILVTAQMAANAIYIEFQTADKTETIPGQVIAIDYAANLALLAPAADPGFLTSLQPATLSSPTKLGDKIEIYQLENSGTAIGTPGTVRSMDLRSSFLESRYFLSYLVKASMQSATSSFTLPAFREGKLTGLLTSYNSKDQISEILTIDVISAFLEDAADGDYQGFPALGIGFGITQDPNFRDWLKLPHDVGGIYVDLVIPGGAAEKAGIQKGDVILTIDGHAIDRRGYFPHPHYGTLFWTHLVSDGQKIGNGIPLKILRDGQPLDLTVTLTGRPAPLLDPHIYDKAPPYLIKGGLVFQELSRPYLRAFGKEWKQRAPMNLLEVLANPHDYAKERRKIVVLTRVIASEATIGYDRIANQIIETANGQPVQDLASLAKALENVPENGIHTIVTDDVPFQLYLDEKLADQVDQQFLQRGLPALSRLQ